MTLCGKNGILSVNICRSERGKKMKKITKSIALLLTAALLFCGLSFPVNAEGEIAVYVDGTQVKFDAQPRMIENRTMVPMRAIFEAIGATVNWNAETRTASSTFRGTTVSITVGTNVLLKNDTEIPLDVPAQVVESRTLVPVRAIAESFDCKVEWLGDIRTVRIATTDLESYATDADREVYATVEGCDFSKALHDAYASEEGSTEERILNNFLLTRAAEVYAEEKEYQPDVFAYDAIDAEINRYILSGKLSTEENNDSATVLTVRDVAYAAFLLQYIGYVSAFDYLLDTDSVVSYVKENAIRVKHILVKTKDEADAAEERLKKGEKFEDLVVELSADEMDPNNGYIFGKGETVEEFEKAAYALNIGDTSEPIRSQYGYHIIRRYSFDGMSEDDIYNASGTTLLGQYCEKRLLSDLDAIMKKLTVTYPQDSKEK